MPTISENEFPKVIAVEQGSTPATPAAGRRKIYPKADGWYDLDDAGVETGPLGRAFAEAALPFVFVEPTEGDEQDIRVPFDCTITRATAAADQAGDIVVDFEVVAFASYPSTVADSITASAPLTLSAADKAEDATLTGWTVALTKGDMLRAHVVSAATVTRVLAELEVERT